MQIPNRKSKDFNPPTPPSTPIQSISHSVPSPHEQIVNQEQTQVRINRKEYSVVQALRQKHYTDISKKVDTLQGAIYKVSKGENTYIIKVTNKELHNKHITDWNGRQVHVKEDILKEADILRYLTNNNPPKSLVKYINLFEDEFNHFLVMQYGGDRSLFEFVKICHQYIAHKIIDMDVWHDFCKMAMKQMTGLVDWLHNTMHCCHLDISLENFVIDNVMVLEDNKSGKITFLPHFQIKIIDFGVSEVFEIDFRCQKYVGKAQYKAPEVHGKTEIFDARSADCHSLFVTFFIMFLGCPPWSNPCVSDVRFTLIMSGKLRELIIGWDRQEYITPNIFGLLSLLFRSEKSRLSIKEIQRHPWFL